MEEQEPECGLQDPLEYQEGNSYIDQSSIVHINLFTNIEHEACSPDPLHVYKLQTCIQSDKCGVFTCASNHKRRIDLQSIGSESWVLKKFLE